MTVKTQNIANNYNVFLLVNISIEANSVVPDQTQSDLDPHCLLKRLQIISADDKSRDLCCIGALRLNKCDFHLIYVHDFHEVVTMHVCAAQTTYQLFIK